MFTRHNNKVGKEQVFIVDISRKRLINDSVWAVITAILNSIFGIVHLLVIGNYWGSNGLGIFSLSISLYLIGSVLSNIGIHSAVLYKVAASDANKEHISSVVYTALLSSFVLGILGGSICFVTAPLAAAAFQEPLIEAMVKLLSFALPLFLINKTTIGILNAHRRMRLIAGVNAIRGGTILLYLAVLIICKTSFVTIPAGFILAELLVAILVLTVCFKTYSFVRPSVGRAKQLISFGWKAALSGVIGDLNARVDILVIGIFWDASVVGTYSVASAIAKGLLLIPNAIQRVTNPLIVQVYSCREKEKLHRTMDVLYRLGTSLFIIIGLAIAVYIKPLITLCYPGQSNMLGAAVPLYFLLPGVAIFSGVAMLGSATSTSIGKPENAMKLICVVLGINLMMNFLLVPFFAAAGAASATTISLVVALICFSYFCRQYLNFTISLLKFFLLFFAMCLLTVFIIICESVISHSLLLAICLIVAIGLLVILKMVCRSDGNLIVSILKSF